MIDKVKKTIDGYSMLLPNEKVVVALSGGADSTALLICLLKLGYSVRAVHINHNLRGEESLRDENFCRALCDKLGVHLFVESVDVKSYCEQAKTSLEEGARNLRYQAINKYLNGCKLATAHNLNDCLETTIFNLARGCSLSGALGVPPVRDNIVRPLIRCTREEIESFLTGIGQSWVTDSTNLIPDCSRNIIRLEVIPKLLEINSGLYKNYLSFISTVSQSKEYLDKQIVAEYERCCSNGVLNISEIPEGILRSGTLKYYFEQFGLTPSYDMINLVLDSVEKNTIISLNKNTYLIMSKGTVRLSSELKQKKLCFETDMQNEFAFGSKRVHFTIISQFDMSYCNNHRLQYIVDVDKLHGPVVARSVNGNEKIRLLGRGFTSIVKKLFATLAPPDKRNELLVLADDNGAFFAESFGVDERVACDGETSRAVMINII